MKLVYPGLKGHIILDTLKASQWIVESPRCLAEYIQELKQQNDGKEGKFVLSDGEKEIEISKYMEIIIDPFNINVNEKKILNKVYAELEQIAEERELYLQTKRLWEEVQKYFFLLEQESEYDMVINEVFEISAFLKAIGIHLESTGSNLFEKLNQYVKVLGRVMKKRVIVFVNFQSYFTEEQFLQIIQTANYSEIAVLFLESQQKDFSIITNRYIIDKDECEIF